MRYRHTRRGVSLVEFVLSTAIIAILLVATLAFMRSTSASVNVMQQASELEQDVGRMVEEVAENLRQARIEGLPAGGGSDIVFLVPVDHDGDEDVVDADLNIEWGAIREDFTPPEFLDRWHEDPASPESFLTRFSYVPTRTFDEQARGVDLNRDGDTADRFDVGYIEKVYSAGWCPSRGIDAPERHIPLLGSCILRLQGQPLGDVDGDGAPDPFFERTGRRLRITFFVTDPDENVPLFLRLSTTVELLNM